MKHAKRAMLLKFLRSLESGEHTPQDLLDECLRRIAERDGEIQIGRAHV